MATRFVRKSRHFDLGVVSVRRHDFADAVERFRTALELADAVANPRMTATCSNAFEWTAMRMWRDPNTGQE